MAIAWPARADAGPPHCPAAPFELLSPFPTPQDLTVASYAAYGTGRRLLVVAGPDGALLWSMDDGVSFGRLPLEGPVQDTSWLDVTILRDGSVAVVGDRVMLRGRGFDILGATPSLELRDLPAGVSGPIAWLDSQNAMMAPVGKHSARTNDGGASWELFAHESLVIDEGTAFFDELRGIGAGRDGLYVTQDGGRTWRQINLAEDAQDWLRDASISPGGELGVVAGSGVLYKTEDQGRTWRAIPLEERSPLVALAVPDAKTIFALAGNGGLWRSFDAGESFSVVDLGEGDVEGLAFADREHGVVTGERGSILVSADAGASWRQLRRGTGRTLQAVVGLSSEPAGPVGAVGVGGVQLVSIDGRAWTSVASSGPNLYDAATDGERLVAIADGGLASADLSKYLGATQSELTITADAALGSVGVFGTVAARAPGEFFVLVSGTLLRTRSGTKVQEVRPSWKGDPIDDIRAIACFDDVLFLATGHGVFLSDDGRRFTRIGPAGVDATRLAPIGRDAALVTIQGGLVVRVEGSVARVLGLPQNYEMRDARFISDQIALVGGESGVVLRVHVQEEPEAPVAGAVDVLAHTFVEAIPLHAALLEEAVVSFALSPGRPLLALTSGGHLFQSTSEGVTWERVEAMSPWAAGRGSHLGGARLSASGVGTLLWSETALIVAGPGGQARRITPSLDTAEDLRIPVRADLQVSQREGQTLYLAGSGRSVVYSRDGGGTWTPLNEDLAPEGIVGLALDSTLSGLVVTDNGRILRYRPNDEGLYESLGREPGPMGPMRTHNAMLWLSNGQGELVVSRDGEDWELVELDAVDGPITTFDVQGKALLVVTHGRLALAALHADVSRADEGAPVLSADWHSALPSLPEVHRLFGGTRAGSVLATTQRGQLLVWEADHPMARCWQSPSASTTRDAYLQDDGWLLVGDGGMIGHFSPGPAPTVDAAVALPPAQVPPSPSP